MTTAIFENRNLKPGIYQIQSIYSETYLDVEVHSRELCCRPKKDLGEGRGLWEIKRFGEGYTVRRVDPEMPEQFCTPLQGVNKNASLCVTAYPIAWRVGIVDDDKHRGFGYVRFYWVTSNMVWDLTADTPIARCNNGARVIIWEELPRVSWQIWRLIPAMAEGAPMAPRRPLEAGELGPLPIYEEAPGQPPVRVQNVEYEHDELGTVVDEVTVVTTTTRRRYRV